MNKSMDRGNFNTVGLKLLSLERLGWQGCPWLAPGNLNGKTVLYTDIKLSLIVKCGSLYLNCTKSMIYATHLFSFWESRIFLCVKTEDAYMTNPNKNLGHYISNEFSW